MSEWLAPVVGTVGALVAFIGSLLNWVVISGPTGSQDIGSSITQLHYNGLSLLEGRLMLVLAAVAVALCVLLALGRSPGAAGIALASSGVVGTAAMLFASIGHPVEVATLYHSITEVDEVHIGLGGDTGLWLALAGAVLILAAGVLATVMRPAVYRRSPEGMRGGK